MWRTARKSSIFPLDLDSPNGSDRRSRCTEESNRGKPKRNGGVHLATSCSLHVTRSHGPLKPLSATYLSRTRGTPPIAAHVTDCSTLLSVSLRLTLFLYRLLLTPLFPSVCPLQDACSVLSVGGLDCVRHHLFVPTSPASAPPPSAVSPPPLQLPHVCDGTGKTR